MSKRINPSHIRIDGAKLKDLLESVTGKTLKEISLENGFSDSFLRMVVKSGMATPAAQAVIRRYGIEPSAYELTYKPETAEDGRQLTIDDLNGLNSIGRDELKALVKESIIETLNSIVCNEIAANYDPLSHTYTVAIKIKKEAL